MVMQLHCFVNHCVFTELVLGRLVFRFEEKI